MVLVPANRFIAAGKQMIGRPIILLSPIKLWVLALTLLFALPNCANCVAQVTAGTGSKQARQQALKAVPFDQLTPASKTKIGPVLEKPSIYRRLPVTSIDVDPDMYLFLVRYPEVMVNIWQIMGVTRMTIDRTGPFQLKTDDGVGAASDVELIYGTQNKNIYYAEGTYAGPLLKRKLHGRCVMILQTKYERGANGKPKTVNSLDVFVKVENATAGLIAKTLNPIVGPTADHNFVETLKFVQRLNETTEQNGTGVQRMAYRLTNLDQQVRDQFVKIAGTVYERGSRYQANQANRANQAQAAKKQAATAQHNPNAIPAIPPAASGRSTIQTSQREERQRISKQ